MIGLGRCRSCGRDRCYKDLFFQFGVCLVHGRRFDRSLRLEQLHRQKRLALAERMLEQAALERVVHPHGCRRHHRLGPVPQGHIPDRDRNSLRQRPERYEDRFTFHLRLGLGKMDIKRAIDPHGCCGTGHKGGDKHRRGTRPVAAGRDWFVFGSHEWWALVRGGSASADRRPRGNSAQTTPPGQNQAGDRFAPTRIPQTPRLSTALGRQSCPRLPG